MPENSIKAGNPEAKKRPVARLAGGLATRIVGGAAALGILAAAPPAQAHGNLGSFFSVVAVGATLADASNNPGFGGGYFPQPPVYASPPPVYYQQQQPGYYQPRPPMCSVPVPGGYDNYGYYHPSQTVWRPCP